MVNYLQTYLNLYVLRILSSVNLFKSIPSDVSFTAKTSLLYFVQLVIRFFDEELPIIFYDILSRI